jgi:hypothetical protein
MYVAAWLYEPKRKAVAIKSSQVKAANAVAAFEALIADSAFAHTTIWTPNSPSMPLTSFTILCAASQAWDSWARRAKVVSQKIVVRISRPLDVELVNGRKSKGEIDEQVSPVIVCYGDKERRDEDLWFR